MLEIIDCSQNSEAWKRARMGIATASSFKTVMASGRSGAESLTRKKYLMQLAGEILTGEPMENYSNSAMDRGHAMEAEARNYYSFIADVEPEQVGFIRNGRKGASPDSLIGSDGLLEIKTACPHILIELVLKDDFPPEHKAQVQGQLWVSEREWTDLIVYWPNLPPLVKRQMRDDNYIRTLAAALNQFNDELDAIVQKVKSHGVGIRHAA